MDKVKSKLNLPALITFIIGMVAVVAGVIVLVINLISRLAVPDAEFLVAEGPWSRTDAPTVIWDFTEVGQGTLTTNDHVNDYDFLWVISGHDLTIQTDWLYELNDTYQYRLDQATRTLTLTSGESQYTFQPSLAGDTPAQP